MLERLLPPGPSNDTRASAISALSTFVGAVLLARASRQIVAAASVLKAQLG